MFNKKLLSILILLYSCSSGPVKKEIPYLFTITDKEGLKGTGKDAIASIRIHVSDLQLKLLNDTGIKELRLPMPGKKDIVIVLNTLKAGNGSTDWIGRINDVQFSTVFLTFTDRALNGRITSGKDLYRINYIGNEVYEIALLIQNKMTESDDDATVPKRDSSKKNNKPKTDCSDDPSLIDVMVVYTQAAETAAGGPDGMNAMISQSISMTNTAYINSGISQQINLVHSEKVDYVESGNSITDRNALQSPSDQILNDVPVMRNLYNADLVVMIVETMEDDQCGVAFILDPADNTQADFGYAVVKRSCAVDNLSFAHELGHLMGARHQGDAAVTPFPYCHGNSVLTPSSQATPPWRTIMSKVPNTMRQPFFSNPGIRYPGGGSGDPTGIPGIADNHQVLNNTAIIVARYRCRTKK